MLSQRARLFCVLCVFLYAIVVSANGQSVAVQSAQPRIIRPVDDLIRVAIPHSTYHLAQHAYDVGRLEGSTFLARIILVLSGSSEQENLARTLVDSQATKGSPEYHHWLTPEDFGGKFGPAAQDIQHVIGWLHDRGFAISGVAKSGRWIEFSGTTAQVEAAFQTEMREYLVKGELHVANATDISIPEALTPVVKGVLSLHNFYSRPMHVRYRLNANIPFQGGPQFHLIAPSDFANIYDLNALYNSKLSGTGETIAVVEVSNINLSDIAAFQKTFGLPANPPQILLNGPDPGVDTAAGAGFEATLDTEWAGAAAPNATIDVVVTQGSLTTDPVALGASFAVDQNLASIVSVSFGDCETDPQPNPAFSFWNSLWEQAAAQGISVFMSSGDTGAAGCDPSGESTTAAQGPAAISGFGSTPFNTAVGGTEFDETVNGGIDATFWNQTPNVLSSANGYIPEQVWNESCAPTDASSACSQLGQFLLLGSGGGLSVLYATPSFQTVSGIPGLSSAVLQGRRGVPDVSLDAGAEHDPYLVCFTTDPTNPDCQFNGSVTGTTFQNAGGGTSFAAPEFAGIMAIVDQKLGGRQGLANYALYPLASNETYSNCNSSSRTQPGVATTCVFNDTTVGNNGVPGSDITNPATGELGYPATTGYDLATGLGSVDAFNLVNAWANLSKGFQGSTTNLSASFNGTPLPSGTVTITHGQAVSINVSVAKLSISETGTPSGDVSLIAQGTAGINLSTAGVGISFEHLTGSGGTATVGPVNVNTLPGGKGYSLLASFPGDGTFAGSASPSITLTIAPEASTTTLRSFVFNSTQGSPFSAASVAYADPINTLIVDAVTAGVSGLTPATGTVTFSIAGVTPLTMPVDTSGIAEFADCFTQPPECLRPGQHMITANYSGDGFNYNGSVAAPIAIIVTKGNPAIALDVPASATPGQLFAIAAVVGTGLQLPGVIAPSGTIQLFDGTTPLGAPAGLSAGQASIPVTLITGGTHSISAQYAGDQNYNAAASAAVGINVVTPFTLNGSATSQTIAAGSTATYSLMLTSQGSFSGQVSFSCTGAPTGSNCTVSPNPATLSSTTTSIPLTVMVSTSSQSSLLRNFPQKLLFVPATALLGFFLWTGKKRNKKLVIAAIAVCLIAGIEGCVISPRLPRAPSSTSPQTQTSTLTVTGTGGSTTASISLSLTVN